MKVNGSHDLNSNSDSNSDRKYGGTTDASTKHSVYKYDLTTFYQTIFLSLQKIHFRSNVIKFVLGIIPKFENIIAEMNDNQMDETPSSLKWEFQTCILL